MIDMTADEIRELVRAHAHKIAADYPDGAEWVQRNIIERAEHWITNLENLSAHELAVIEAGIKSMKERL